MAFNKPTLKVSIGGIGIALLEPLVWIEDEIRIEVPMGFSTDGASVPRGLWSLLPPFGSYLLAAVLHDYLYRTPGHLEYSRTECDAFLNRAMVWLDVPTAVRVAIYKGVRIGGGSSFS